MVAAVPARERRSLRPWLARLAPRGAILITAAAELMRGDFLYGSFCLLALLVTLAPAIHARSFDAGVPVELELVLLWFMVADMTLGNWLGLYQLPWYDKALHLSSSVLIALLGFLAIYVVHLTHHTRFHPILEAIAILLVTLGIGALWEIAEYAVDHLFARSSQGSPGLSPIDDTMFDLMMDGLGGILGAILGPIYIRHSRRSRAIVSAFRELLEDRRSSKVRETSALARPLLGGNS